jgi:molecular chaperone DnaJ
MAGSREALLIATGTYDNPALSKLRSPARDSAGLAEVLGDPEIGGFRVEQVLDAPSYRVARALERFFRSRGRDDLLLLHLSCHGIKDDDGRLHFAARDTDKDLPASTAVPAAFLHDQMARCRARSIVVLLDCCYSGAFLPGTRGDGHVHVRDELAGHGRAILTATNRTEYAWEGERMEAVAPQPSRFTGALIDGLRSGAADLDGDGRVTVTELYEYVYERLRREGARQTPRMWAELEYQVVIARAAAQGAAAQRAAGEGTAGEGTEAARAAGPGEPGGGNGAEGVGEAGGAGGEEAAGSAGGKECAGGADGAADAGGSLDLYITKEISRRLAASGGSTVVPTPHGRRRVLIPRNFPHGRVLRFPGLGTPRADGSGNGDLYIRFEIRR